MRKYTTTRLRWFWLLAAAALLAGCDDDDFLPGPRPMAAMDWVLFDGCTDGLGLQAAFFDFDHGRIWPSSQEVYVAPPGGAIDTRIVCEVGALICYGAETDPLSDIFWGVGIDGQESCADCCEPCEDALVEIDLVCGHGVTASGKAAVAKPKA